MKKQSTKTQERKAFERWAKTTSDAYVAGTTDNAKQFKEDARKLRALLNEAFVRGADLVRDSAYAEGAAAAADVADDYNAVTGHPYRLGDCILGKMNLRDGKIRRNKPDAAFIERFMREHRRIETGR